MNNIISRNRIRAQISTVRNKSSAGATEIAGVDNVARAKKQGLKTREWTSRHEEAGVDIARVDNVARRSHSDNAGVDKAARRNRDEQRSSERS